MSNDLHGIRKWCKPRARFVAHDIRSIIYRVDNPSSFLSLREQKKVDASAKRKDVAELLKLTRQHLPSTVDTVLSIAQMDHFAATADHNTFFSLPEEAEAELTGLDVFFNTSQHEDAAARRRRALGREDLMLLDIEQHNQRLFFRLAVAGLGRKKTMKVSPVSGRKLSRTDLTVMLAKPFIGEVSEHSETTAAVIDSVHASKQPAGQAVCVLSDLGDPHLAVAKALRWKSDFILSLSICLP